MDAAFDPASGRLDLQLGFSRGARFRCPHCGAEHQGVHDTLERTWRHLKFFQYQAYLHAKVPRVRCEVCAKTSQVPVPWARQGSGFTLLMEALLLTLCQAMPVRQVAQLLAVSDMRVWRTLDHWLKDTQEWTNHQILQFDDLKRLNLKTHRAFRIKEALREIFHTAPDRASAEPLLERWYSWARRCRIEPIKQVAKSLKNHWEGILNAFDSKLTNGRVEAANGQIQAAKAKARGYGTIRHLITISYLIAGKLNHLPASPFKAPALAQS
jgi:transposase